MIKSPGDRTAAVRQLTDSVGGSLESAHWMFAAHDGFVIADVPRLCPRRRDKRRSRKHRRF
jgi:uncharacterized protein with GYD domain